MYAELPVGQTTRWGGRKTGKHETKTERRNPTAVKKKKSNRLFAALEEALELMHTNTTA
jgi:hypothetical protein